MHRDTGNKFEQYGNGMDRSTGEKNIQQLTLGQVDFINCLPINLPIEQGKINVNAKIINDVPSKLNEMILNNEIDIAPVSSVTYLENKDKLIPISNLCIASDGPADSVFLFSKFPIEELGGTRIGLSYASSTSNKLLEIILKDFSKVNCVFEMTNDSRCSAYLSIGDHALHEYSKMPRNVFVYDLGSLWKKYTGLPMVFGIWVARKEIYENCPVETRLIASLLRQSLNLGLREIFDEVIKKAQSKILLPREFYTTYFQHLNYEFDKDCKRGLEVFEECCNKTRITFQVEAV